jgi:hypothetical protein
MERRDDFVKLRVTPAEKAELTGRAQRQGLDLSTFMRRRLFADSPLPPSPEVSVEARVRELTGRGLAEGAARRIAERELETV